MDQRADKSGNKDDTYYAATWHIPLEVLIEYSERKLEFPKANFPYYMSKEKGVKYQCHPSLVIKPVRVQDISDDKYYFVAPITTRDKFEQEVLNMYTTPSKTSTSDGISTVNTRSQSSSRNSDEHDMSRMSSLTHSEEAIIQQSEQSKIKDKIIGCIDALRMEKRLHWSHAEELMTLTQRVLCSVKSSTISKVLSPEEDH